ncbi:hypothetical protein BSU04_31365 [Caballeronia sordidicola]|uniref:Uncharacterized protein n=1 Tax=Caballeronia sordidicola TaxID=196367 RepID=A0A226WTI9_CABSO|nr:hypothetical protein BSU04_31365 [Caballeronia sordidicola]
MKTWQQNLLPGRYRTKSTADADLDISNGCCHESIHCEFIL